MTPETIDTALKDQRISTGWAPAKPSNRKSHSSGLHLLTILVLLSTVLAAGIGLFYHHGGAPQQFINQYGDAIDIYGKGLYRDDSFFRALIFRGTDATMLFLACPLLLAALLYDVRKRTIASRMMLVSLIACFSYYATNIAFGVRYNVLHLLYIVLFAASFFSLVGGLMSIQYKRLEYCISGGLPVGGIRIFLWVTGVALFAAWLPDILMALLAGRPPLMIENYTTEITYVLDMGLVAPCCFVCLYLLRHGKGFGYVLLDMLLTLCIIVGVMLPVQTLFQVQAGITLPVPVLLTKVGSFCALAMFALYFKIKLIKALDVQRYGAALGA